MTSIRQMKRHFKKSTSCLFDGKASKVTWTFGDETAKVLVMVGLRRKLHVIISKTYLRRVLEVQKTKKLEAKKGGRL